MVDNSTIEEPDQKSALLQSNAMNRSVSANEQFLPASATPWSIPAAEIVSLLATDISDGLSETEAESRRQRFGQNRISTHHRRVWFHVLLAQLANVMVGLLVAASIISACIGEWTDAILILLIVIANAIVGFSQEWTAEKAVEALRKMTEPMARVCRSGQWNDVPAVQLVAGDLIEVNSGDIVPADARLLKVTDLETAEASLTGESNPVEKSSDPVATELGPADRLSMVFAGTSVVSGHGLAVVTEIGSATQVGRIAELLATAQPAATPLQQRLDRLARQLTLLIVAATAVMFVLGLKRHGLGTMLLTSVGLAVAALPEGLPAVITIGLAIGAKRMAKRNAIIRRLTAVETLGSVNVICTDKTGTLTQNKMTVSQIEPAGEHESLRRELLHAAALCSDATVDADGKLQGSPTEIACLAVALENGIDLESVRGRCERVDEMPFTSTRKRMATLHRATDGDHVLFVKGAIERILPHCVRVMGASDELSHQQFVDTAAAQASQGQRVLAFARRVWQDTPSQPSQEEWEGDWEFLGLLALSDPLRDEARESIRQCQSAGIQPVLITGDHAETARSIAMQLGIYDKDSKLLTGTELDKMSDDDLRGVIGQTTVYARVSPEHKLRIVRLHQGSGAVTAMTGDGVNDAPALQQADIGVAMGLNGTEVAKDASALVLADDNFATIVSAVEEGRTVFDNIRKSLAYLFAGNAAEVLLLFVALIANFPLPLIPIQILWINLVTDGLPALAMAFESPEASVMRRVPRGRHEGLFGNGLGWGVLAVGVTVATALLLLFREMLGSDFADTERARYAQTAVFMALGLVELIYAISVRDLSRPASLRGLLQNKSLVAAIVIGVVLQFAVCYVPLLQRIFHTVSLAPQDLAICLAVSMTGLVTLEIWKWIQMRTLAR